MLFLGYVISLPSLPSLLPKYLGQLWTHQTGGKKSLSSLFTGIVFYQATMSAKFPNAIVVSYTHMDEKRI